MKVLFGPDLNFHSLLPGLGKRDPCCLKLCTHIEVKREGLIWPRAEFPRTRKKWTVLFQNCVQIARKQLKVLFGWDLNVFTFSFARTRKKRALLFKTMYTYRGKERRSYSAESWISKESEKENRVSRLFTNFEGTNEGPRDLKFISFTRARKMRALLFQKCTQAFPSTSTKHIQYLVFCWRHLW